MVMIFNLKFVMLILNIVISIKLMENAKLVKLILIYIVINVILISRDVRNIMIKDVYYVIMDTIFNLKLVMPILIIAINIRV